MTQESLLAYYGRRAVEYERVYQKPERQEDLRRLTDHLRRLVAGHDVLELACGTGYWTARLARRRGPSSRPTRAPRCWRSPPARRIRPATSRTPR